MTQDVYKLDDLSNDLEKNKLTVVNKYNYDRLPTFEYIASVELSSELNALASTRENFCKCSLSNCVNNIRGQCLCDGKDFLCCSLCSCFNQTEAACSKQYLRADCLFQVYYVNPQKKWGLRTFTNVKKDSILFEYAGILSEDKDSIDEDDYIYTFEYLKKKYIINAHKKGNLARFVNHSCEANCSTQVSIIDDSNTPHLLIIAARDIVEGEEITLNYGPSWWNVKMIKSNFICSCGIRNCQYSRGLDQNGKINRKNYAIKVGGMNDTFREQQVLTSIQNQSSNEEVDKIIISLESDEEDDKNSSLMDADEDIICLDSAEET